MEVNPLKLQWLNFMHRCLRLKRWMLHCPHLVLASMFVVVFKFVTESIIIFFSCLLFIYVNVHHFAFRQLSLSTNSIEKIANLNGLSK